MNKTVEEVIYEIDEMRSEGAAPEEVGKFAKATGYDVPALQQAYKDYKKTGKVDISGVGTSALQGLTFGFSEEIGGAVSALTGGDYDEYVKRQRNRMRLFEQQSPVISTVAEMAGSLPTLLVPGAAAARGAQVAGKLGATATGAAVAGAEGALYGAGKGEGLEGRVEGALTEGGISALLGGALGKGGSLLADRSLRNARGAEQVAAEEIAGRLSQDSTPFPAAAGSMIADTSEEAARYLRGIRSTDPTVSGEIDEVLSNRFRNQYERLNTVVADAFEDIPEIAATIKKDLQVMKEASSAGYDKVFTDFLDMRSPALSTAIRTGDAADYWDEAVAALTKEAKANKDTLKAKAFSELPKAKDLADDSVIPLEVIDMMKKNLYDDAYPNPSKGRVTALKGSQVRALDGLRTDLVNLADEATGQAYAQTRKSFAEPANMEKALEAGRASLKDSNLSALELREMYSSLDTIQEKRAFTAGTLQSLFAKIGNTGYSTDAVTALLKSPEAEAKLRAIIPNDVAWNRFKTAMAQEARQVRTRRLVSGGSNTAEKLVDKEAADTDIVNDLASLAIDPSGAMTAGAIAGIKKLASSLLNKIKINAETRGLQAKMLTETDPVKKAEIAKKIAEARKSLGLRQQAAQTSGAGTGALGGITAPIGTETETQGFEQQ